jgi:hypothetical protein
MNETAIKRYFDLTDEQWCRLCRQHRAILWFIYKTGSITPMDAFVELNITKLSTRVSEMKVIGVQFGQSYESRKNQFGMTSHYMRYRRAAA